MHQTHTRLLTLAALLLSLATAGCSSVTGEDGLFRDRAVDYKQARTEQPLEVPPDLNSSSIDDSMVVPDINPRSSATYSQYSAERPGPAATGQATVLPENPDIQVMRDGDRRWVVVKGSPDAVWTKVRDFWLQAGFLLKREDPQAGIMETDWAENRADIPKGLIRDMLGKVLDQLYSASTRDKFRVRLERGQRPGTTEVYITHFGAEEVVTGGSTPATQTGTIWQSRPREPELEAEMLNRLMVYMGAEEKVAQRQLAATQAASTAPRATLTRNGDGTGVLSLGEEFSRAWRRVGIALDRSGFTVEDRDRSRGIYYVRYVDPMEGGEKKGFLSKLAFWNSNDKAAEGKSYLVRIEGSQGESSHVTVLDGEGKADASDTAYRILTLLRDQLK